MNKRKICVYAICKNESKFVDRWYNSIKDADYICVLDTGSTDDTVSKLLQHNIHVTQKEIVPWRFDTARNISLKLIPDDIDICICLDLDEVMTDGWKNVVLENWDDNTTRLSYIYNWKLDENNKPIVTFYADKIHINKKYTWVNPVHEVLTTDLIENKKTIDINLINHYPDDTKSRSSYLELLELAVKENPDNDRNTHYLGREYMYNRRWNDAIDTLIKHLNLKNATWKDERCASMRYISKCYINLNRIDESRMWLQKAIKEAPYLRECYVDLMILEYSLDNYIDAIYYGEEALKIKTHHLTYINEKYAWDETINDILSICYFYIGNKQKSLENIEQALKINPNNERIINNKKFFD